MSKVYKNFIFNMIGSTTNACISLFLLIFVTRINGVNYAGIFSFAFAVSCLLQVIGNYSGRAYQVTEREDKIDDSDFIYNKMICCFFMFISGLIFVIMRNYSVEKNIIILLLIIYKIIESISEVIYGIIQKHDDLYKVGISLLLKGILGIIIFLVVDIFTKNLFISIFSIILLNIFIILFYDINNLKKYKFKLSKFNKNNIFLIFKLGFATFLFTILTQYLINSSKYAIDFYLTDKYQTIFGIIVMPATVIGLCVQFIIHPFLNILSDFLKKKKYDEFNKKIFQLSCYTLIIGVISCIVAYIIGIPFLQLIYHLDLTNYKQDLVIILLGATFFGISCVISNALVVIRDTKSQVYIFIVVSIFAYFISNYCVLNNGVNGASLSYLLVMSILMIIYILYYLIKFSNKGGKVK